MIGKTIYSLLTNDGTLTNLVPAKDIYPYMINENTEAPCIVYFIDAVVPYYNKRGWAEDEVTFTVESIAKNYPALQNIAFAVRGALELSRSGAGTQEINRIYLTGMDEGYLLDSDVYYNKLIFKTITNKY